MRGESDEVRALTHACDTARSVRTRERAVTVKPLL